jgi:DNA-binding XRE family transcriptional regulator
MFLTLNQFRAVRSSYPKLTQAKPIQGKMDETPEVKTFAMLRKEAKLTQRQLANALDVTEDTVANWEAGRSSPKLEIWQVKALCRLLGKPIEEVPDSFVSPKIQSA